MSAREGAVTVVPRIETERLLLREFRADDFEPYAAIMADPDVARHLGDGRPMGRFDAWRSLAMFAGHWALKGFGVWAVEEKATGAFMGRIGCWEPADWPGFEIAYTLGRPYWGKGYASEGAAASLRYARETLGRTRIISIIRPDNAGSIAVATKLGAVREREIEFFGGRALVYAYPR
jgi:RimJ/RimL family protein N-acetyltransferase